MSYYIYSDGTNHKVYYNGANFKLKSVPYESGLLGIRYNGYFDDNFDWFATATTHGDTNTLEQINNFSSNDDFYSWEWNGYFKPSTSENYTFTTDSDDASYLWIDNNLVVNNGGLHGNNKVVSSPVYLTADTYYPIRIIFGEYGGGDFITVTFYTDTISETTNGTGYYFH